MPTIPQHVLLVRSMRAITLIRERPRGLAELVAELELPQRAVERTLVGLRRAGIKVVSFRDPSDRRWRYAIRDPLPGWLVRGPGP